MGHTCLTDREVKCVHAFACGDGFQWSHYNNIFHNFQEHTSIHTTPGVDSVTITMKPSVNH